jgi:deoxyribonuclease-4
MSKSSTGSRVKAPPLGAHLSIAGGISLAVDRAVELGVNAFQCFGGNPRGWAQKPLLGEEVERFKAARTKADIWPIVIHTSYLINLSSPDAALFKKSVDLFALEIERAQALGVDYLVTHLGSARGKGADYAIKRSVSGVKAAIKKAGKGKGRGTEILFENTAGTGTTTGSDLVQIGAIIESLEEKLNGINLGLCFDTCHGFAAGYALKTKEEVEALVKIIKKAVGIKRLKVIHLNDSKGAFNSRRDRHEHIGKGEIKSFDAFLNHKSIKGVPLILETPKEKETDDKRNLARVSKIINEKGSK